MLTLFTRAIIIYIFLAFILRIMGKRQVGELEVTELVATLLLSEIASMVIDDTEKPILYCFIPVFCILLLEVILSFCITKSNLFKKIFEAKPSILIKNGVLDQKELERMRISIEEFLGELRLKGAGNISLVQYAILEQNGQLSVFLYEDQSPDSNSTRKNQGIDHPLIIDGTISQFNCKLLGYTEKFIFDHLKKRNLLVKDIFLMTIDDNENITIIVKEIK